MKTIYTPIAVSSGELPEHGSDFIGIDKHGIMHPYTNTTDKIFKIYSITHWLKKEEVPELTEEEIAQEFKELNIYLDDLYQQGASGVKDAGHLWIAFTDKFNAFRNKLLCSKVEVKWEDNQK